MPRRSGASSLHPFSPALRPHFRRLAVARCRLALEHALWIFKTPVLFIAAFYVIALTGIFGRLFAYLHIVALAVFTVMFVQSLGRAYRPWRPRQQTLRRYAMARRDFERARGQRYRLPDVLEDQPNVSLDAFDQPQLALAKFMLAVDNALPAFALPLVLAALFTACAWLGVFPALFPWAHIALLVLFTCLFFDGLAYAFKRWRPLPEASARRLVEQASGLRHRPLDVLDDRIATLPGQRPGAEQQALWQAHSFRAKAQTRYLDWPRWRSLWPLTPRRDPYALRYGVPLLLAVAFIAGWGMWGGRIVAAINPALRSAYMAPPALDAWLTPPAYTKQPPVMIATPAGLLQQDHVIEVPQGSILSAHLAERDGDVPTLVRDDKTQDFTAPDGGDFAITSTITGGDILTIKRGWRTLGSWQLRLLPDVPPQIAFTDQPRASARQSLMIGYSGHDDYGITQVTLKVTPKESLAGVTISPFDVPLATPDERDVHRTAYADLTASPLAGMAVTLQLVASDAAGQTGFSQPVDVTLPQRVFLNAYARALAQERARLLQKPLDGDMRNDAANLMAGIAHEPASYHNDPVVALALRAGAVRLILDLSVDTVGDVADIMWQSALRMEDGASGEAAQNLRQAQQDLTDALDRHAPQAEVQQLIDRLHQALAQYLSQLALHAQPAAAGELGDLKDLAGSKTNMLTPRDLDNLINQLRDKAASGDTDAARDALNQLQQIMENLRQGPPGLTPEQKAGLQQLKGLKQLTADQQQLIDRTFTANNAPPNDAKAHDATPLAAAQQGLAQRLQDMLKGLAPAQANGLDLGVAAMQDATNQLRQNEVDAAMPAQGKALKALQDAQQQLQQKLQQSMMMLGGAAGQGSGQDDPFGRNPGGAGSEAISGAVPDHVQPGQLRQILDELQRRAGDSDRPKEEHDYIDRLLQDF